MSNSESSDSVDVQLYGIRWFYLAVTSLLFLLSNFAALNISQINNIFTEYFHVSYAVVDWGSIGNFGGSAIASMPVAWLTFTRRMKYRLLVIATASLLLLSFAVRMAAFLSSTLFALVILSQFLNGLCLSLTFPMSLALTMAWFPENEIGTALGSFLFGGSAGLALGSLLPSQFVIQPPGTNATTQENWKVVDRNACLLMWGVPLVISLMALFLMIWLAADQPPKPPTLVQGRTRNENADQGTFYKFLITCREMLTNKTFTVAAVVGSIAYHVLTGEYTMMTQLMTKVLRDTQSSLNVDVISSYSTTLLSVGGLFGSLAGGKVVDISKRYKLHVLFGELLVSLSSALVLVSYHFDSYKGIFVANVIFGFAARFCTVLFLEILTQIAYPIDEAFVATIFNSFGCLITVFVAEVGRLVFDNSNGLWMLVFQTVFAALGLLLSRAISSENKRYDAERILNEKKKKTIETSSLLDRS